MEWLCTYWINGVKTRSERQELLSLLCLELSSLLDEDPDEAQEAVQKAALIKEKAPGRAKGIQSSGKTDFNTSEAADKAADLERNILTFQADIANTILTGLEQYDTYAEIFYNRPVPCEPHMTKVTCFSAVLNGKTGYRRIRLKLRTAQICASSMPGTAGFHITGSPPDICNLRSTFLGDMKHISVC